MFSRGRIAQHSLSFVVLFDEPEESTPILRPVECFGVQHKSLEDEQERAGERGDFYISLPSPILLGLAR
jgi:FPC/CPF motif-containing protein YcgG